MSDFLRGLADQLNLKGNAPQWAATLTGLIGTSLGLATDDPWLAIIGALIGAALGWVVQKLYTVPKDDQLEGHFVAADLPLVPEDLETIAADAEWEPEEELEELTPTVLVGEEVVDEDGEDPYMCEDE